MDRLLRTVNTRCCLPSALRIVCQSRGITSSSRHLEDSKNVWKLANVDGSYWNEYLATRPKYNEAIFNRVHKYHTEGINSFKNAIDIGTGAGSTLPELLCRFEHVLASDNDPISLEFAKNRFSQIPTSRLSYTLSTGENLVHHVPASSSDLVTCALTFPLLDTATALHTMSTLLRPGGTLAIWFYGPPFFTEDAISKKCQALLYALADNQFRPIVSGQGPEGRAGWKRAADGMTSWLDYIPFPSSWQDIHRHKWNSTARLAFFGPEACDFQVETVNNVREHERLTEEHDSEFWGVDWDIKMIERFILALYPKPMDLKGPDARREELLERLSGAMGGPGMKRHLSWPAVLILARKT